MAAQAREQENQSWVPSDGQVNYYSSIGSDNGYETVRKIITFSSFITRTFGKGLIIIFVTF